MPYRVLPPFLALPVALLAQQPPEQTLSSTRSWRCDFPSIAISVWEGEKVRTEIKQQEFSGHIDNVDIVRGTARLIGNVGAADLTVIGGAGVLHFLELTPSGNLNVTTIFARRAASGGLRAVHSRHVLLPVSGPLPSQAVGTCRVWN